MKLVSDQPDQEEVHGGWCRHALDGHWPPTRLGRRAKLVGPMPAWRREWREPDADPVARSGVDAIDDEGRGG